MIDRRDLLVATAASLWQRLQVHENRHDEKSGAFAALFGSFGDPIVAMPAPTRTAVADLARTPFGMVEVAPGLHIRRGVHEEASPANQDGIANIGFVIGRDAVAVIDPGGSRSDGERLRASIREVTGLPIRYLITTHLHPDHVFGAVAFAADAPRIVAHANVMSMVRQRGEFYKRQLVEILGSDAAGDYALADLLVETRTDIDLGDRVLHVRAHGTAHTDNDLSIVDSRSGTLLAGDLLFVDRVPALDGSLGGWLAVMDELARLPAIRAVPGHGPPSVPWPAGAADQRRYLQVLARDVRAILAQGGDIETAVATAGSSERERWALFDDYNGRNVTIAFKEAEWE